MSRKEKFYQALLFFSVYSCNGPNLFIQEGGFRGGVQGACTFPPPHPQDDLRNYDTTSQLLKKTVVLLSLHCQQSLIMSLLLRCSLLKFVDVTHQLRHSFVGHPSPPPPSFEKFLNPPLGAVSLSSNAKISTTCALRWIA